ncbi:MAG: DNA polymerase III subunit gamma/tau [Nitrospirae bacterium]|nr:DNA polymerase III subunit gamma/tau [Nitrospirota bacterium]
MTYQILSRKWRPQTFAEVIGQEHVTRTLSNALASNRLAQAYLFSGPRGVGKTTTARILAKALNCSASPAPTAMPCGQCVSCRDITAGTSVDVLEIDGASNTGVDDIRELREQVKYIPFQGRYKVYIIDEVHMLSNAAFNALLKTLEEPPPHLLFVFATTEAQKILPTILSRCQRFHFKRVGRVEMMAQIARIAAQEGITIGERACSLVAKASEGSVRDALSVVDQVVAYGGPEVREEDVVAVLGVVDREGFETLSRAIHDKDPGAAIAAVRSLLDHGHDVKLLCADLVEYVRHLTLVKLGGDPAAVIDLPKEEVDGLTATAASYELDELQRLFAVFAQAQEDIRAAFYPPFTLEMALVKATRVMALEPIERLIERVEALSARGDGPEPDPRVERRPPPVTRPPSPVSTPVASRPPQAGEPPRRDVPPVEPALNPAIGELWQRALRRAMDEKPNLGSYLEAGRVMGGGPDEVVLEYDAHQAVFGDMVSKEEHRAYLTSLLKELAQRDVAFRIRSAGSGRKGEARGGDRAAVPEPRSERVPGQSPPQGATSRRRIVSDVLAHPLVKEALDVFGGEVMEVRDIKRTTP